MAKVMSRKAVGPHDAADEGPTPYKGVYWYRLRSGEIRFRCFWTATNGTIEWKRGFLTEIEADRYRGRMHTEAEDGLRIVVAGSFSELYPTWLRNKRNITEGTRGGYEDHYNKRLLPAFADHTLRQFTYDVVDEAVTEWDETGDWAPKTINNALGALSSFMADMWRQGKVAGNVVTLVDRIPEDDVERDWLREREIDLYLDGCSAIYRPVAENLLETGVRISEALSLKVEDTDYLDSDSPVLMVRRTRRDKAERERGRKSRGRRGDREGATKGKEERAVAVGPEYAKRLLARAALVSEMAEGDPRKAYLFQMPTTFARGDRGGTQTIAPNTPLNRSTVSRDWHKDALREAGLRDMPLHALRHTAAALWLADHDLEFVRRQLGHKQITTTQRIYGHMERALMAARAATTERRRRRVREAV